MKSIIKNILMQNKEGLSSKDLKKKCVKEYLSQNNLEKDDDEKGKKVAKIKYKEEVNKLLERGKIVNKDDIIALKGKDEKKTKKDKKKRKRDDEEKQEDGSKSESNNLNDNGTEKHDHDTMEGISTKKHKHNHIHAGSNAAENRAETVKSAPNGKEKSTSKGFNLGKAPDINPITGKKLKKRSKEAYERRRKRYLMVKKLDSRNKRAQEEFAANKEWISSANSTESSAVASTTSF